MDLISAGLNSAYFVQVAEIKSGGIRQASIILILGIWVKFKTKILLTGKCIHETFYEMNILISKDFSTYVGRK